MRFAAKLTQTPRLCLAAGLLAAATLIAQQKLPATLNTVLPPAAKPSGAPLDLNLATAAQLSALPGMGSVYARRIIEGRPYVMKNQLVGRGILPQLAYDSIKDSVIAHRAPR